MTPTRRVRGSSRPWCPRRPTIQRLLPTSQHGTCCGPSNVRGCAFSDGDPITKGGERVFLSEIPGTAGQPHVTIEGGGHFLQEDKGEELGRVVADFIARG